MVERAGGGGSDPADPYARKVGDFYAVCMDEAKAETASLATVREELRSIDAVQDAKPLAREVGQLHKWGARPFFGFGSRHDFKDATQLIGVRDHDGLRVPHRDYYLYVHT